MNDLDAAAAWLTTAEGWTAGSGPAPAALAHWWQASQHPDAGCDHAAAPGAAVVGIVGIPGVCWCPSDAAAVFDAHRHAEPGCASCHRLVGVSVVLWRIHPLVAVVAAMCPACLNPQPDKETEQ